MSQFDQLITQAEAVDLKERKQFVQYLLNVAQKSAKKLSAEDKAAIRDFAFRQVDVCAAAIPDAQSYKEKDSLFELEDLVMGIVMTFCPAPGDVPADKLMKIQSLVKLVEEERKIETTLDSIFRQDTIQETDINRLLYWVKQTNDEYQRAVMYPGILHYRSQLSKFTEGAKVKLSNHIHEEIRRILVLEEISGEAADALELLADVCKFFPNADTPSMLIAILKLKQNRISYYAVESLLTLGQEVPQNSIDALAQDLIHANLLYGTLAQHGKSHLFPRELSGEEYLAKNDLVHWLTYPTELGQAPDEIQYIGKITYLFKKDVYHVFKFRSDSETLGDDLRNKWLIGWSGSDGGTFSNFDEFENFDLGTTDKTLKNIKKKLIG